MGSESGRRSLPKGTTVKKLATLLAVTAATIGLTAAPSSALTQQDIKFTGPQFAAEGTSHPVTVSGYYDGQPGTATVIGDPAVCSLTPTGPGAYTLTLHVVAGSGYNQCTLATRVPAGQFDAADSRWYTYSY
jgi:hypothetical protein